MNRIDAKRQLSPSGKLIVETTVKTINDRHHRSFDDDCDEARKAYLTIFREQPDTWKEEMTSIGNTIVQAVTPIFNECAANASLIKPFSISFGNKLYEFPIDKRVVLVGRMAGCDVKLPEKSDLSRLHTAIFLIPETSTIYLTDIGSLNGITMKERSEKSHGLRSSVLGARHAIQLKWDEWSVLQLSPFEGVLTINPKECIICMNAPRQVEFGNCGHFATCQACAVKTEACPLCKVPKGESMRASQDRNNTYLPPARHKKA